MNVPEIATSRQASAVRRGTEGPASYLFILGLVALLGAALGLRVSAIGGLPTVPLIELVFWSVLVLAMNIIPFTSGDVSFTLDTPLLLTVALLYPPEVACIIAFVGSMDIREVQRRVGPMRALFNRTQIALSVLVAGLLFRSITGGHLEPWILGALGTALALIGFHAVNATTVGIHTALRSSISLRESFRSLTVGPVGAFLATYLGYGVLALVLAHLFVEVGPWSVALFLIPLEVGRQMLVRGEALERLTEELRHRERLLERLLDRIDEERGAERVRIATGLHDDIMQSLIRMSQLGSFLRKELPPNSSGAEDAAELAHLAQETGEQLRRVLSDLQRSPVGRGGLVPSLKALFSDLQLDWQVEIALSGDEGEGLSPASQVVGYQTAREAVINALKHAEANRIEVILRREDGNLTVSVSDDGEGFDPESVDESQHFGLGLMRTRIRLAGGELAVNSSRDTGTTVEMRLPEDPDRNEEVR